MTFPNKHIRRFFLDKWYEVSDFVLGRGNFSTVYLAYHSTFKNKVALKIIDRNNIEEEYVLRNLKREASILMKLSHPNIVNFYEELSYRDVYCLSMEYVNGVNLRRYLKKQESLKVSEDVARLFFYQMVSAVHHMHKLNILHRDLKQENVLVEFGRVIKIIDFGLSNVYQPKVQLRTHCGSFVYAAPELFQTHSVYGAAIDLWSLGVILYSMVIGRMPFGVSKSGEDDSVCDTTKLLFLQRISQGLMPENRNRMRDLSFDCCNLLETLLQPNQFKRLRIKEAIIHPWFENKGFKKRLPQQRLDLKQKFQPQIIDFMAAQMGTSTERIKYHLLNFKYSKICAIYFIAQDTLIKEVLYPPRDLEHSFIYKFECWRRSVFGDLIEFDEQGVEDINEITNSQGFKMDSFSAGEFHYRGVSEVDNVKESKKSSKHSEKIASIRKSAGDGSNFGKKISSVQVTTNNNRARAKFVVSTPQQVTDKSTETDSYLRIQGEGGDCKPISHCRTTNEPFRSYKRNRPPRFQSMTDRNKIAETEPAAKYERSNLKKWISKVSSNDDENSIDVSPLVEKFNTMCKINSHQMSLHSNGETSTDTPPRKEIAPRFSKSTTPLKQYPIKIFLKRDTSELPQSRPATNGQIGQSVYDRATNSSKTHQEPIVKEIFLSEESNQQHRLKSRTIRRDCVPIVPYRSSQVPVSEFRYGNPSTFIQKPAFGTSMRNNTKEYRNSTWKHRFTSKLLESQETVRVEIKDKYFY